MTQFKNEVKNITTSTTHKEIYLVSLNQDPSFEFIHYFPWNNL
jgi:hypothetical protein